MRCIAVAALAGSERIIADLNDHVADLICFFGLQQLLVERHNRLWMLDCIEEIISLRSCHPCHVQVCVSDCKAYSPFDGEGPSVCSGVAACDWCDTTIS